MKMNNHFKMLMIPVVVFIMSGCKKSETAISSSTDAIVNSKDGSKTSAETMLFKSYFSNTSFVYQFAYKDDFDGTNEAGYSWASGFGSKFSMYYDEGAYADRRSTIVSDTDGDKIIQYEIKNASVLSTNPQKARIQTDLYSMTDPTLTNTKLKDNLSESEFKA